jgi:hypothetical protein
MLATFWEPERKKSYRSPLRDKLPRSGILFVEMSFPKHGVVGEGSEK